jgi:hypothetical protein
MTRKGVITLPAEMDLLDDQVRREEKRPGCVGLGIKAAFIIRSDRNA